MTWVLWVLLCIVCFAVGYCLGLDRLAHTMQAVYNALLVMLFEKLDGEMCRELANDNDFLKGDEYV